MHRSYRRRALAAIPLVVALAVAAGSAHGASRARVNVRVGRPGTFSIVPSKRSLAAGKVTFAVTNDGSFTHELIVIPVANAKTVLPKGKQPGTVREKGNVGSAEDLRPGASGTIVANLEPGTYQLFCNVPGHYQHGMHTVITVK
jgi:uncharacterized cupredoxin-like copper-binding protein